MKTSGIYQIRNIVNEKIYIGTFVAEYESVKEAQRLTGILKQSIIPCYKGVYKTGKGFMWKYKNIKDAYFV